MNSPNSAQRSALYRAWFCFVVLTFVPGQAFLAEPPRPALPQGDTPADLSIFEYFQHRLATQPAVLAFPSNRAAVPAWRDQVASRLRDVLGLDLSIPVALQPRVLGTYPREGYRLEHVVFTSEQGVDVPAYVLIPDGVDQAHPSPAVLCLQGGNDGGKDELAGELAGNPAAQQGFAEFQDDFARQLARAGFVSMAIDFRTNGERFFHESPDPFKLNGRGANAVAAKFGLFMGQTYFGLNLFDAQRALDYLQTRPEVRHDALACAGFSFGGSLAAWLSAIDRRVRVVALEGNWPSWRRLALRDLRDGSKSRRSGQMTHFVVNASVQVIPGFLHYLDMNLTVAAVAPTPMVISFEGESPHLFNNRTEAEHDIEPINRAYEAFEKKDDLHLVLVPGGHHWRPEVIMPWFTERLRKLAQAKSP